MTNFKSVDFIVSAKHYGGSARKYIRKMQTEIYKRGTSIQIKGLDKEPVGAPVRARIWQGQWIADCEHCNGASFVDPDEPIFFCFGCGNRINNNQPRPVIFPPEDTRKEIERLILERPVNDVAGLSDLERAGMARAIIVVKKKIMDGDKEQIMELPLTRSWLPDETIEDLHNQQDAPIKEWKKKGGNDGIH